MNREASGFDPSLWRSTEKNPLKRAAKAIKEVVAKTFDIETTSSGFAIEGKKTEGAKENVVIETERKRAAKHNKPYRIEKKAEDAWWESEKRKAVAETRPKLTETQKEAPITKRVA